MNWKPVEEVWRMPDKDLFALWPSLMHGYLVLPPTYTPALPSVYVWVRFVKRRPAVILSPLPGEAARLRVLTPDLKDLPKLIQIAVEGGAWIRTVRPYCGEFTARVFTTREEAVVRLLCGTADRGPFALN